MANSKYAKQRERVTPPHVSLTDARKLAGLTLDGLCQRYEVATGDRLLVGSLSAIENGHRGASQQVLDGLAEALGLNKGSITTTYQPKRWVA